MVPDLRQFIDLLNLEGFWRSVFHHWGFTLHHQMYYLLLAEDPRWSCQNQNITHLNSGYWVLMCFIFSLTSLCIKLPWRGWPTWPRASDIQTQLQKVQTWTCLSICPTLISIPIPCLDYSSPTHIKPWLMCVSKLMHEMRTVIIYNVFSEFLTDIGNWANLTSAPNSLTHSPSFHHSLLPSLPQ